PMTKKMNLKDLGYKDAYQLVHEDEQGRQVYAHTYYFVVEPSYDHYITEDDTPVDNLFSEKERRLLIDPLFNNIWTDRDFVAASDVGIFYTPGMPPVAPDMFLSMDVRVPASLKEKKDRSYFCWLYGKSPDLVVEIVSNKKGGELDRKKEVYSRIGVPFYILIDPYFQISKHYLQVFRLDEGRGYMPLDQAHNYIPEIQLGIRLWEGLFEKCSDPNYPWARWCDKEGRILKTGSESRKEEKAKNEILGKENADLSQKNETLDKENTDLSQKNESLNQKNEALDRQLKEERAQAEKLAARLKELGLDPDAEM
ncbi:MAG: Uma2 family endonuclease, partial [Bacteroidota bacterium]